MLKFDALLVTRALGNLANCETLLVVDGGLRRDAPSAPETVSTLKQYLAEFRAACHHFPLSTSLKDQIKRLEQSIDSVGLKNHTDRVVILRGLQEVRHNTECELGEPGFFYVPSDRKGWYSEDDREHFGEKVAVAFPDSTREISEAFRCLVFDRWTAGVFHLMRALELALHKWALELGVDQFNSIELENWKNILDAADKKIRAIEQDMKKGPEKDAQLQYYGETSAHFRSIKDAWRNHVAHARTNYDEQQALSIVNHVSEFMRLLANRP